MIKTKKVCICDICGKSVDAVARPWQYNDTEYFPPEGWGKGSVNTDVDICPECYKKLNCPTEICRNLKDMPQADWDALTTVRGGTQS